MMTDLPCPVPTDTKALCSYSMMSWASCITRYFCHGISNIFFFVLM